ncbi:MAG: alpha/beta hydrolase [Cyanobacteria bacterium RYN_339]|nr:alpha/beta hydrolase [Cyanobacteria bacterium RYN_339]
MKRLLLALCLTGCAPADVLNAVTPAWSYQADGGQAYGADPRQVLDVYRPTQPRGRAVVFFYGGRWEGGNRRDFRFVGDAFAARGYTVVVPDYRVYPQVKFPAFIEDGAKAVRWTRDHARELGCDPDRLLIVGHSSGAHTAVMLGLDAHFLQAAGVPASAVRGVVGLAGPYDFEPFDPDIATLMGPESGWPATQPINFARAGAPPLLLLQGDADDIVKPANASSLETKILAAGGEATRKAYAGLDHYKILVALAAPLRFLAPVRDDVADWLAARE